ncbi:hypothetical protein CIW50_10825 [Tardiphaga sp. P9-11]|jgi:hypothetical protein|nr:hypothetical protein CIW50_10825 [Tardiphaga sp. P9-11]
MWSFPVPRFFFHIIAENTFLDDEGTSFSDDQEAMLHARELAVEMMRSIGVVKGAIVIENEDSGGLFEVPLSWSN